MPARTKPLRAAPLASGPGIPVGRRRPQKPLPKVSARRIILNRQLANVVAAKRQTVTSCEAEPLLRALVARTTDPADLVTLGAAIARCRRDRPTEAHHMLLRSRGNDASLVDPANIVMVDRSCHAWITDHDRLATLAGLVISSWEA